MIEYFLQQGHNGSIKVNRSFKEDGEHKIDTSTLEIRVLIDGSKEKGKVKDLKQLSGKKNRHEARHEAGFSRCNIAIVQSRLP